MRAANKKLMKFFQPTVKYNLCKNADFPTAMDLLMFLWERLQRGCRWNPLGRRSNADRPRGRDAPILPSFGSDRAWRFMRSSRTCLRTARNSSCRGTPGFRNPSRCPFRRSVSTGLPATVGGAGTMLALNLTQFLPSGTRLPVVLANPDETRQVLTHHRRSKRGPVARPLCWKQQPLGIGFGSYNGVRSSWPNIGSLPR